MNAPKRCFVLLNCSKTKTNNWYFPFRTAIKLGRISNIFFERMLQLFVSSLFYRFIVCCLSQLAFLHNKACVWNLLENWFLAYLDYSCQYSKTSDIDIANRKINKMTKKEIERKLSPITSATYAIPDTNEKYF